MSVRDRERERGIFRAEGTRREGVQPDALATESMTMAWRAMRLSHAGQTLSSTQLPSHASCCGGRGVNNQQHNRNTKDSTTHAVSTERHEARTEVGVTGTGSLLPPLSQRFYVGSPWIFAINCRCFGRC